MLRHKKGIVLAAVVAVLVVLYATGLLPDLPDAEKLIEDIATGLGWWTYVLVGLMAFLETSSASNGWSPTSSATGARRS